MSKLKILTAIIAHIGLVIGIGFATYLIWSLLQ